MKPRLFIGSSKENVDIAHAVQLNLHDDTEVTVWDQGIFKLSQTILDSLINELRSSDFGMFIFAPDDLITIRGKKNQTVRDNVILELGLFVGLLGKNRCFILVPEKNEDLRIPTDLLGITPASYETDRTDQNLQAATGPVCTQIRQAIKITGPRSVEPEAPNVEIRPPKSIQDDQTFEAEEVTSKEEDSSATKEVEYDWFYAFIKKNYVHSLELLKPKISKETEPEKLSFLESWAATVEYYIDPKQGLLKFNDVRSKYPTSHHPYARLAFIHMECNHHQDCLTILEEGIPKVSIKSSLIRIKAKCLQEMGRSKDVLMILRKAIEESPETPENYESLADNYIDCENYPEARSCLEEGLSVLPLNELLLAKYAKLLSDHINKKVALIPLNQLVDLFPNNPTYLVLRANVYLELELHDLAMRDYKLANQVTQQKQSWIFANIGNLQKNRGFYREAIEHLQQALKIAPEDQYTLNRLATSIRLRDEEEKKLSNIIKEAKKDIAALQVSTHAEDSNSG